MDGNIPFYCYAFSEKKLIFDAQVGHENLSPHSSENINSFYQLSFQLQINTFHGVAHL